MAAEIPEPSWRRSRPPGTRRAPITRDAIVGAALDLLDRRGLDAVSMRRVASELGTGAASLYWHVADKDELLDLAFDRVIGEIAFPEPDPARWQEQVKDVLREIRRVMNAHRDIGRVALGRWPVGPNALRFNEGLLAILRAGGLPPRTCAYAAQLLPSYVGWYGLEEATGPQTNLPGAAGPEEVVAMMRGYLGSLPPDRFPHTLALLDESTGGDADERFEFGVDVLVRGIAAQRA
jgi:AcrR family transcriptional regulator